MLHDPSSAGELKPFAGLGRVVKRFPFFWGGHISTAIVHTIPVFLDGRIYWTSKILQISIAILPALQFLVPGSSTGAIVRRASKRAERFEVRTNGEGAPEEGPPEWDYHGESPLGSISWMAMQLDPIDWRYQSH